MWASVDAQQTSPRADIEASDTYTSVLPGAALEGNDTQELEQTLIRPIRLRLIRVADLA